MNIYIGEPVEYSDMQGPCPDGFHVPLTTEWQAIFDAGVSLGVWSSSDTNGFSSYLKIPKAGYRLYDGTTKTNVGAVGYYWSSSPKEDSDYSSYRVQFGAYGTIPQSSGDRSIGCSVRGIKDTPVIPTSSWTTLYQGTGSAGIFYNSTDGLISISSNGTTWYTIMDKNLGATTVYNNGDTLTDANCGNVFQRGNNYKFPGTKSSSSITTSSTTVDTTGYGPGNYYDSSTFITVSHDWSSVNNTNLRGGVSQGTYIKYFQTEVKNIYIGEYGWKPGSNTLGYRPFKEDILDHSGNNHNFSITRGTTTFSDNACTFNTLRCTDILFSNYSGDMTILAYVLSATSTASFGWASAADWAPIGKFFENNYGIYSNGWYYVDWNGITYPDLYVAVKSGTNVTLYKGGSVNATGTTLLTVPANNTGIYVGGYRNNNETMKVGNLIVENRAWTADEIQFYYNMTKKDYGIS